MNLLALETSTHRLSVALWRDGACLERAEQVANGGSERLLPWVNELLAEAGISLADLDGIAFGAGPGGFTGLRLACGVAQGLAFGLDLPVIGITTLEALAVMAGERDAGIEQVFASLDARMNEVYCAAYRKSSRHRSSRRRNWLLRRKGPAGWAAAMASAPILICLPGT